MEITVALKEWALVCDLLLAGEQVALLRKGGIHEPRRGFAIEHEAFFLYPNAAHQNEAEVQPRYHALLKAAPAPAADEGSVPVPGFCRVVDVVVLSEQSPLRALEQHTPWTEALFEQRLRYKPARPLFLVTVRAYRFQEPVALPYHKVYAGCRSWVPLRDQIDPAHVAAARPALDDAAFEAQRRAVLEAVGALTPA